MSSARTLLGAAAVAALVWFNSAELPLPIRSWTTLLLAGLPPLMIAQARQLRLAGPLPRVPAYVSSIASLWLLAALTVLVARAGGWGRAELGLAAVSRGAVAGWTVALTAAGLLVVLLFHRAGFRESDITRQLVPETAVEKGWFAGVSVTAGICEEAVFRGFLITALSVASGSVILALLLSSVVFGIVHAYQQPLGALRAGVLGALLAAPLLLHGTILPAIIAHALLDLLAGIWLARYLMR